MQSSGPDKLKELSERERTQRISLTAQYHCLFTYVHINYSM